MIFWLNGAKLDYLFDDQVGSLYGQIVLQSSIKAMVEELIYEIKYVENWG